MNGQMAIAQWMPSAIPKPEWVMCFRQCRHFDTHPDFLPDFFPGTRESRCRYCDHKHGTSGDQFKLKTDRGVVRMFCIHFEPKEAT